MDRDNRVFVSDGNKIVVFGPGALLPDPHTLAPEIDDVGHTTAEVGGLVELGGGSEIVECTFVYGLTAKYEGAGSGQEDCTPDPAAAPPGSHFSADTEVSAQLSGLSTGQTYHFALRARNADGVNFGIDRVVVPAFVLKVQTLAASEIDTDGAILHGSFDPDGKQTQYSFEYGITPSYGFTTPVRPGGQAPGVVGVEEELSGLPAGRVFHYRVVATNADGTTKGPDLTFRVGSPPEVSGARATEVSADGAVLHARINPTGFATKYHFEYGTTPEYGELAPAQSVDLGEVETGIEVEQAIDGLQSGLTYHFRVVAENQWGVSRSPDTTFDYAPPGCPNDHVRQQSGSSYLPDCRAYELVSPESAGAVLLFPGNTVTKAGQGNEGPFGPYYHEGVNFAVNRGFAGDPSRFSFFGGFGAVSGLNAPVSQRDMYMSTRTTSGWETTLPGLNANEGIDTGRKECSESMALCTDHSESQYGNLNQESAPYLFTADGVRIGRLPTNLDVIPGGTQFRGSQRMSGDFSHFVFASTELASGAPGIPFVPDAQVTGVGSAYDNDLATKTVTLISKLPDGRDIPTDAPLPKRSIDFPGLSPDGSHVLMQTPAGGKLRHLFMRVDQAVTYEIAAGIGVQPLGMTRQRRVGALHDDGATGPDRHRHELRYLSLG